MLSIRCTLLRDVFEGGHPDDPRQPEWPPSWMRLFSALVSVAEPGSPDDALLRRLEQADPPSILVGDMMPARRSAFVPTNRVLPKASGHTVWPARTNSDRAWARAVPSSRRLWYRWDDLELGAEQAATLRALCRRVPYLGRSTSPVIIELDPQPPSDEGWLQPRSASASTHRFEMVQAVRSPFDGALDALRDAHEERFVRGGGGSPWQIGVGIDYGRTRPLDDADETISGPYQRMVVLAHRGRRIDGRHTARVAHAVRRALLSRATEHVARLHGHHDGSVVQCAITGLVDVGHPHARGHLLGVGICLPGDVEPGELRVIVEALPDPGGTMPVTAGRLGELRLERLAPLARSPWGLRPERWMRPSRHWATALPAVLDRFLKRNSDLEAEVDRAVRNSGLPTPRRIAASRRGRLEGAPELAARDTLRRPQDRGVKPYRHLELEFEVPVSGPVVIGSMRHYGLGLCVPVAPTRADGGAPAAAGEEATT